MSLLEVQNLKTYFYTPFGSVKAVDDVSFNLERGVSLGLVGESGCGKTTAALSIMRILPHPGKVIGGKILFKGIDLLELDEEELRKIRWTGISTVFQGAMASLNPLFKIGYQIAEPILIHEEIEKEEALDRVKNLLELVGIDPDRVDNYPWELSGGMRQRVMAAMALACNPEILIADEPTTALDVIVAAQVMNLIKDLREKLHLSMILITHDISVIAQTCDELAVMYAGKLVERSDVSTMFDDPKHPYTHALINAFPNIKGEKKTLGGISGNPPDLINPPSGCRFHTRCRFAKELCKMEVPITEKIKGNHTVSCHFWDKISLEV
jgi:oligopeptide/dipeptide ABC transporter ATP-binding protein